MVIEVDILEVAKFWAFAGVTTLLYALIIRACVNKSKMKGFELVIALLYVVIAWPVALWDINKLLVQEYISGRSLLKIMQNRRNQGLPEPLAKKYFQMMVHATKMMH